MIETKSDIQIKDEINSLRSLIRFEKDRISRIALTIQDYNMEREELQEELDRRDISEAVNMDLPSQIKYFSDNYTYDSPHSNYYWEKCKNFFWVMRLERDNSSNQFLWYPDSNYISENMEQILYYLPHVIMNTKPQYVMETEICHHLYIRGKKIMNMNYFPHKNLYCVEGTYLRQYDNLRDALNYILEEMS